MGWRVRNISRLVVTQRSLTDSTPQTLVTHRTLTKEQVRWLAIPSTQMKRKRLFLEIFSFSRGGCESSFFSFQPYAGFPWAPRFLEDWLLIREYDVQSPNSIYRLFFLNLMKELHARASVVWRSHEKRGRQPGKRKERISFYAPSVTPVVIFVSRAFRSKD